MPLLQYHHTSSLTYWPWCKRLNEGKKPYNVEFSILTYEKTLQPRGNTSCSGLQVAIWTRHHPETHSIVFCWLMFSLPCGPSARNHRNCLLVALKRCHRNCYCVALNVFCIVEITEIPIMIHKV